MKASSRLDQVFENATPIYFDKNSKFVFFSDQHRGDDSLSDEFGRNKPIFNYALKYYYDAGYTYVEVGDGDEIWEHNNFELIRNAHVTTFNRLKDFYDAGRMYMLFGNHNICYKNPARVARDLYEVYDEYLCENEALFPGIKVYEGLILIEKNTGQEIFVVHGHQGDLLNDTLHFLSYGLFRFLWRFMHIIGLKNPASPAKSRRKRHKIEKMYDVWIRKRNKILICGHTHRPKFAIAGESAYFNSGSCVNPRGIFCLELVNDCLSLATWRVSTKRDGTMIIKRTVLNGPVAIEKYNHLENKEE